MSWLANFFRSYSVVQIGGVPLPQESALNFTGGSSVTAVDDAANGRTNITIVGGGGAAAPLTLTGVSDAVQLKILTFFGQSHNSQEWQDHTGTANSWVDASGGFFGGQLDATGGFALTIGGTNASSVVLGGLATPVKVRSLSTGLVHTSSVGTLSSSTLVDADVNAAAAIAVSKLAPGTNTYVLTTTGGVAVWAAPSGGGSTPTGTGLPHIVGGVQNGAASLVVDADVSASAAVAVSKLAAGSGTQPLATVSGVPTWVTVAGDWSGAMTSNVVTSLSGSGGIVTMKCAALTWASTVAAPTIGQAAPAGSSTNGTTWVYSGQPGGSGAGIGGTVIIQIPKGGSTGAAGGLSVFAGNPTTDQLMYWGPDGSDSTPTCPNTISVNAYVFFQPTGNVGSTTTNQYEVQTTDATAKTIATFVLANGLTSFSAEVTGTKSTNVDAIQMVLSAAFLWDGTTLTTIKASQTDDGPHTSLGASAWTAAWSVTGHTVTLKVTGASSTTVNWSADVNAKTR